MIYSFRYFTLSVILTLVLTVSCGTTEDNTIDSLINNDIRTENTTNLTIRLTDAPASFDAVYVDLQRIRVRLDGEWSELESFEPIIIDLLELQDGVEEILADEEFDVGILEEVRVILGEENSVVVGGESLELKIPSGQRSGFKIKINQSLEEDTDFSMLIDFDALLSIKEAGESGKYILKPVIKVMLPGGQEVEGEEMGEDDDEDMEGNGDDDGDDDGDGDGDDDNDDDGDDDSDGDGDDDDGDGDDDGGDSNLITICHIPPGNPENPQTLEISENAWPAHEAHGDELGSCEGESGDNEDDNNEDTEGAGG